MCGIAGIAGDLVPDSEAVLPVIVRALAHRGPDGEGVWFGPAIHLGHRRLAVIDTTDAAAQPMQGASGSVIVFNGEIYNHLELRAELEARGVRFRTRSDTEVLLAAYETWGEDCLPRLAGMFAFAIWDAGRRVIFLARDRLGKKPLYLFRQGRGLAFASEAKALLTLPAVRAGAVPDLQALSDFLSLGYILSPKTAFANIARLPPAHAARFDPANGAWSEWRWWNLAEHVLAPRLPYDESARDRFRELLSLAVSQRLQADVPLGIFLSGGVDSAAVAASAAALHTRPPHAFTVGFNDHSFDERAQAEETARHLGLPIEVMEQGGGGEIDLGRMVWHCDEPFADTSLLPTWQLDATARRRVTVALSGDGADEILAGYPTYRADQFYRLWRHVPGGIQAALARVAGRWLRPSYRKVSFDYKLRQFLGAQGLDRRRAHYWWRVVFSEPEKRRLLHPDIVAELEDYDPYESFAAHFAEVEGASFLDQSLYVDVKTWLADDILVKIDRMSMAVGLEVRSPFLDHRLVEFAFRLPPAAKMAGTRQKVILKDTMRGVLPAATLTRRKQGFGAPTRDLGRLDAPGSFSSLPALFNPDFVLDDRAEDVTYKSFSLRVLGLWLERLDNYRRGESWNFHAPAPEKAAP